MITKSNVMMSVTKMLENQSLPAWIYRYTGRACDCPDFFFCFFSFKLPHHTKLNAVYKVFVPLT